MNKKGFTLAEVLITLGIIGVVAAMTLPTLIQNYRKHEAETKLAKFYSMINQAVKLSEVENGPYTEWNALGRGCNFNEEEGKCEAGSNEAILWYEKYLAKYITVLKVGEKSYNSGASNKCVLYFPDGTVFEFNKSAGGFYLSNKDYEQCGGDDEKKCLGRKMFIFYFMQSGNNKAFEPFDSGKDKYALLNDTTYGCNHTASNKYVDCAALIQINGWKIPKDYPLKF